MTAREGMTDLLTSLRIETSAGTADYTIGAAAYWTDDQLQNVLDKHRINVIRDELVGITEYTGGVPYIKRHFSHYGNFESGTLVFKIEDGAGNLAGTTLYTPDYANGEFTFTNDVGGSIYYLTGKSYDINAAAADVWNSKAAHYSTTAFDFSTDGHSVKRSQIVDHCLKMAQEYKRRASGANGSVEITRNDANVWDY